VANRVIEGFDAYDTAALARYFSVTSTAPTVSSGNGRGSSSCMRCASPGSANRILAILDAQATWIVGAAVRFATLAASANTSIFSFLDTTALTHVTVAITSAGQIRVLRNEANGTALGTGSTVLLPNTYYYIEAKITISDTVGAVEVKIDGVTETITFVTGTSTTQDTRNGGNATASIVTIGSDGNGGGSNWDYDDLYVNDGSGGVDDTYWGDIRVIGKTVDGAGNSAQFTPSAGSNYQNVDDATPNGDTDYNESSTVNHIDSMTTAALGYTGTVKGVQLQVYARKTDGGAGSIAPLWRISGTDYAGTGQACSVDYRYLAQRYRVSPATSSAFTVSEIDGAEIGYKRTA
jgi:hypothetical protein